MASFGVGPNPYVVVEDQLIKEKWDKMIEQMLNYGKVQSVPVYNTPGQSNYVHVASPTIRMPPHVANTIESFKVHVVERYDTDMEMSLILGAFSNREQAEAYAKANGGWEYTVHEFTLDSEVPVENE